MAHPADDVETGQRRMMAYKLSPFDSGCSPYFTVGEVVGDEVVLVLAKDETAVRSKLWVRLWSRVVR